ncbi:PREDICTED: UDP-glucose iridoid glucosyltransferase-like [Prunus mume]|uniref:UDP-glucose iridoid glucosyltransferase-like n=1 Tax=Prunus mume TaxID=102107 RepID=A0ABM1LTV5_PRUMU|nr:PREDICTED: UDP-glucose iridoid glucosyltransferase-like [Prunus mume]
MLQLGTILHSKGFYITIAHTQFNFPNPLNYPDFNFLEMYEGLHEQNVSSHNFIDVISGFNANCKAPLQESLAQMMEKEDQHMKAHDSRSSLAIIWNTTDCLEQSSLAHLRQEYQLPWFPIGPLHRTIPAPSISLLKEDQNCISWMDKHSHNSVIHASVGRIAFLDSKELAEMVWALANSEHPFLWVVRTNSISLPESFQETVGERGCITKWAPQKQVLAHSAVGGFWSHCGWNSTIESISEGVPMICQPYFGDQRVNSRYLSQVWAVGLEWENDMNRGPIEEAIRMLMVGKEGEVIRERTKDLKVKIELSTKQAGSSYNSLNELVDQILSF